MCMCMYGNMKVTDIAQKERNLNKLLKQNKTYACSGVKARFKN